VFGFQLSHKIKDTTTEISSLPKSWRDQLASGIAADSYQEAVDHATVIEKQAEAFKKSADGTSSSKTSSSTDTTTSKSAYVPGAATRHAPASSEVKRA
jgi:protein phosphatase